MPLMSARSVAATLLAAATLSSGACEAATAGRDLGVLSGTVSDSDGKPIEGAVFDRQALDGQSRHPMAYTTSARGAFEMPLESGRWAVVVRADGYLPVGREVSIAAGRVTSLDATLEEDTSPSVEPMVTAEPTLSEAIPAPGSFYLRSEPREAPYAMTIRIDPVGGPSGRSAEFAEGDWIVLEWSDLPLPEDKWLDINGVDCEGTFGIESRFDTDLLLTFTEEGCHVEVLGMHPEDGPHHPVTIPADPTEAPSAGFTPISEHEPLLTDLVKLELLERTSRENCIRSTVANIDAEFVRAEALGLAEAAGPPPASLGDDYFHGPLEDAAIAFGGDELLGTSAGNAWYTTSGDGPYADAELYGEAYVRIAEAEGAPIWWHSPDLIASFEDCPPPE
jgi:hypothetical protein